MHRLKYSIYICLFICILSISGCGNKNTDMDTTKSMSKESKELDLKSNDNVKEKFELSSSEKKPYIKEGHWWIENTDTGITADESKKDKLEKKIKGNINKDNHLIIKFPDGTKVDAGYVNVNQPVSKKEYSVCFLDYDGSEIIKQNVKRGENAVEPENPERDGYIFAGWDKDFTNVKSDLMVYATYVYDNSPIISVDTVNVKENQKEVDVPVYIKNNPGILGMALHVEYNDKEIELVGAENGEALKSLSYTPTRQFENGCNFLWDGEWIDEKDIQDGHILTLKFKLKDNAKENIYKIALSYYKGEIVDNNVDPLEITLKDGAIIL